MITITGPRQSGKITLCKTLFSHKEYCSLEDIDERQYALEYPRGCLVHQMEIKSGKTVSNDFFKGLNFFLKLNENIGKSYLIYGGEQSFKKNNFFVTGWQSISSIEV